MIPATVAIILFGILQGLTEFLPVSSSAHLSLFQYFSGDIEQNLTLNIAVHVGTLCTVLVYYRRDLFGIFRGSIRKDPISINMLAMIVVANLPTAVLGLLLKKKLDQALTDPLVAACCLLITGALLFVSEKMRVNRAAARGFGIGFKQALIIGGVQGLAVLPGISRSGATIVTGLFLGMNPGNASRFSFLVSLPAILGAALIELISHEAKVDFNQLWLGMLVSFVTGLFAISWMVHFTQRIRFKVFAFYVVFISISFLILYAGGWGRGLF